MNNTYALDFLKKISEYKIPFDICEINPVSSSVIKLSENLDFFEKKSASETSILFGTLVLGAIGRSDLPISAKIFIDSDKPSIMGLKYEALLYKKIMEEIIIPNYSPNFVSYVGYGKCNFSNFTSSTLDEDKYRKVEDSFSKNIDNLPLAFQSVNVLLTERVGNGAYFGKKGLYPVIPLADIRVGAYNGVPLVEYHAILFQVLYALELMKRFRIMHNDLHAHNILVMQLPEKVFLTFNVDGKFFLLHTKYIPYIYDWDFGYTESLGNNMKIEKDLLYFNIRNKFREKVDLYTLFCTLEYRDSIMDDYNIPSTNMKETNQELNIDQGLLARIWNTKSPFLSNIDQNKDFVNLYKIEGSQARAIFGPIIVPNDIINLILSIRFSNNRQKFIATYYNPFRCRITSFSSKYASPLDLLLNKFPFFETRFLDSKNPKYTYTLPRRQIIPSVVPLQAPSNVPLQAPSNVPLQAPSNAKKYEKEDTDYRSKLRSYNKTQAPSTTFSEYKRLREKTLQPKKSILKKK